MFRDGEDVRVCRGARHIIDVCSEGSFEHIDFTLLLPHAGGQAKVIECCFAEDPEWDKQAPFAKIRIAGEELLCPWRLLTQLTYPFGVGDVVCLRIDAHSIDEICEELEISAVPLKTRNGTQVEVAEIFSYQPIVKIITDGGKYYCPVQALEAIKTPPAMNDDINKRPVRLKNERVSAVGGNTRSVTANQQSEIIALETTISELRRSIDTEKAKLSAVVQAQKSEIETLKIAIDSTSMSRSWIALASLPRLTRYTRTCTQALPLDDPKRYALEKLFVQSCVKHRRSLKGPQREQWCDPPDLEVINVESVANERLLRAYHIRLEEMEGLRRKGCTPIIQLKHLEIPTDFCETRLNEVLLFHGARPSIVESICNAGFDPRRGGESVGRMFGAATYLTPNASKADIYTEAFDQRLSQSAQRKIIVVRAALGESFRALNSMGKALRPPDGADGHPLDSVWAETVPQGGAVDHLECMVYEKGQAIPIAVITYTHRSSCTCSECCKRREFVR